MYLPTTATVTSCVGFLMRWSSARQSAMSSDLADGFEERQALDVADRAADLGDDHVHVVVHQPPDRPLDLVGDVRDDLDGAAEVVAVPLFLDDGPVDLAGGVVALAAERGVGE